jgi:site-specific recombinase
MTLQPVVSVGVDDHVAALLTHIEARSEQCRERIRALQRRETQAAQSAGFYVHMEVRAQAAVLQSQVARLQVAAALAEAFLSDTPLPGSGPGEG